MIELKPGEIYKLAFSAAYPRASKASIRENFPHNVEIALSEHYCFMHDLDNLYVRVLHHDDPEAKAVYGSTGFTEVYGRLGAIDGVEIARILFGPAAGAVLDIKSREVVPLSPVEALSFYDL